MPDAAVRYADAPVVGRSRPVLALLGDERLVEQVCRGSHAAFEALYERHHRGILAFCRHMLGSGHDAEEAVQQSFTAAYADLAAGERPSALKPWLYGIARHRCLEMLRKRRNEAHPEESHEGVSPAVTEEVERRTEVREMLSGVSHLPEPQRTALVLFGLCGHAQSDVAAVLGCDEARVRALVYQARSSLLEDRRARETPCHEIREKLALGRGGALRRRAVRRHVKFCPGCAEFRAEVLRQRRVMGFVPDAVPSLALKTQVLTAVGLAASAGSAGTGGAATGMGGLLTAAKVLTAALLLTATPMGGGLLLRGATGHHPAPARHAATAAGVAPAADPAADARAGAFQRPTWTANGGPSAASAPAAVRSHHHAAAPAGPPSPPPPAATPLDATLNPPAVADHGHGGAGPGGHGHGHGPKSSQEAAAGRGQASAGAGQPRGAGHGHANAGGGGGGGGNRNGGHSNGGHGNAGGGGKSHGSPPPQQSAPPASSQSPPPSGGSDKPCVPPVDAGPVAVASSC